MKKLFPILSVLLLTACTQSTKPENNSTSTDTAASASSSLKDPDYLSGTKFINDYPTNETVDKLYDEIDFQRACQAYIWAIPTVYINELYVAFHRDLGYNFNDINVLTAYAKADNIGLTANNNTIYGFSVIDLSKGPVVIESPAGAYGCIDDWWQRPIT